MKDNIYNDEQIRELILMSINDFGFEEHSEHEVKNNAFESIKTQIITKGVFKSKDNNLAIVCNHVSLDRLPSQLERTLLNQVDVESIYEGEEFLLCLADSKIYCYKIDNFRRIKEVIDQVEFELPLKNQKLKIGFHSDNFNVLIFSTDKAMFLIAGNLSPKPEEEERVILSRKLEASLPFFKFKSPIQFSWSKLIGDNDVQFERVCELLLNREYNLSRITPIGKTRAADRGRDFEVVEKIDGIDSKRDLKWLVQCKFSDKSISPSTISGWTDRVIEHNYDGYWLMTNNDITPSLFDQFKDVSENVNYKIKTKFWQRNDFNVKLNVNSELFINGDIFRLD